MPTRNKKQHFQLLKQMAARGGGGLPSSIPSGGFPASVPSGGGAFPITVSGPFGTEFEIPGTGGIPGDIDLGDPSIPGDFFAPDVPGGGCLPFFTPDPVTGECRFDIDPGAGQGLPGGNGAAGGGMTRPSRVNVPTFKCPVFADGKTGILWMDAKTGDVVCLPRRTSGKGFGLIRKNKPRTKPFISAAEHKLLSKISSVQKRAKTFAGKAGFTCKKK